MAGLFEYAANTPAADPGQDQTQYRNDESMQAYIDRQGEIEKARELMNVISQKLAAGEDPQIILYTAVRVIGILMHGAEWEQAQYDLLNERYGDLAQQNMFIDAATVAADRAEKAQRDYANKTLKKLESSRRQAERLIEGLDIAIHAARAMTSDPSNPAAVERRPGR